VTTTAATGGHREAGSVALLRAGEAGAFHSILFPGPQPPADRHTSEASSVFSDLNLDQVINAVTAGRDEYDLRPFCATPLRDVDTIIYRHEVLRDIERSPVADALRRFAQRFRELRQHLTLISNLRYKHNRNGWFLHAVTIYGEALLSLKSDLQHANLNSRGLLAFRDYLAECTVSDYFTELIAQAQRIRASLSTVRYCVLVSGLTVRVRRYEEEADYSAEVSQCFDKFRQRAAADYRVAFPDGPDTDHVEAQILDCVARLYPEIFAELDQFCTANWDFQDQAIRRFDREIQFYLAYLEFINKLQSAGLQFCYPRIATKDKAVHVRDGFDLALAAKLIPEQSPVVCNDFYLRGNERILVVSGPNQGGKTTFARTFGQVHYLASLGLTVPGSDARLFLFDQIFTHFAREEDLTTLRGALANDLVRLAAILDRATSDSIVILNEIFNSTTIYDATFLGRKIIDRIMKRDALCVCVTFVDELASLSENTVSMVSTVVRHNPALRTYKIVRKPADGLAYALAIAEKYRVTYQWLIERLQS
jgi:DNA mismatch repair protein MutS